MRSVHEDVGRNFFPVQAGIIFHLLYRQDGRSSASMQVRKF